MKVTKIHLKDYLNFQKDLVIDLTYPSDYHEPAKRGQPLDKVCFIGQSGTGKTTLLNLIKFFSYEERINPDCLDQNLLSDENVGVHFKIGDTYNCSKWSKGSPKDKIENVINIELIYHGENGLKNRECQKYINEHFLKEKKVRLISFPFDAIRNFNTFYEADQSYKEVIQKPEDEDKSISKKRENYLQKEIWDFSIDRIIWIWQIVVDLITEYEPDYIQKIKEFLAKSKEDKVNASKYYEELETWEKAHENPVKKITQKCLDRMLSKFNLKVNTEIDFEKDEHKRFLRIQQLNNGIEVPFSFLSTGTIQSIITALPLSVLNIDRSIILFDEPERSLFPETQIELVEEFTKLVPNSQFFFATHSPIVASAFEPCERIILDFDDESGQIVFKKGNAPEGDDPNDLLIQDFGLVNVLGKKGIEQKDRYVELKTLIHLEDDETKKEELMKEFMKIGIKYRFGNLNEKNN